MRGEHQYELKQRIRLRMENRRKRARNRKIIKLMAGVTFLAVCGATYAGLYRSTQRAAIEAQAATMESKINAEQAETMAIVEETDTQAAIEAMGSSVGPDLAVAVMSGPEQPEDDTQPTVEISVDQLPDISAVYAAHAAGTGWTRASEDNTYCKTRTGSFVTNIKASVENQPENLTGTLRYKANLSGVGWLDWVENNAELGSADGSVHLEAIMMELNGDLAYYYDVYYSVFQDDMWTAWVKNGAEAGVSGAGKRVDGIRVSIRKKDSGEPEESKYPNGIDPSRPMVALTYDDGPSNITPRILAVLEQYGARATFFMVGNRVPGNASVVRQMVAQGSEVANHSFDHVILTKTSQDNAIAQIARTNQVVAEACGVTPRLMRPPGGGYNDSVRSAMASLGMPAIMWSIDTLDWKTRNAQSTIDKVLSQVKDGDIILMHDLYGPTADASAVIIPELVSRGYQLVTVSEMAEYRGGMTPGGSYGRFRP